MANRKARARRRAAEQKTAREQRREADRALTAKRARTAAAARAKAEADDRRIARHDAAVLPLIRQLRDSRATWQQIADYLDEAAVSPPGGRDRGAGWSAAVVWRIARRAGLAGRLPRGTVAQEAPVELEGGRLRFPDGRVVRPIGRRWAAVEHEALVLPAIRTMRARGASWREIAERLEAEGVISPGRRDAHVRARGWTANAVWRIGRRHGVG